ncbi:phosphotransferase [Lederbergia lenta]|uniref:Aminoglycoside phosphotransferase n=1 Tax=Lederbergia lenta TaxID=1467 RepID=A0A2X4W923_LEDLE|nr:hypothetical protein [Lederbergia lenta]MEC2324065.1 aminoglycoside phosphotransferase family protein [Lederbergia lenta]SQI60706.1 aminoglycoside phosphotransferase [Lederbergia lenta]
MRSINEWIWNINNLNLLPFKIMEWEELKGGTSSSVWKLLGDNHHQYVLKNNDCDTIKAESHYLFTYQSVEILPKVVYVDISNNYYIYTYLSGEVKTGISNKKIFLKELVSKLISHYTPTNNDDWGWIQDLSINWHQYLVGEINAAREIIGARLTDKDYELVKSLAQKENRRNGKPYLLHGDCGVHNFLQKDNRLVAVIDPMPLAGPLIYELVFAFCSSPEQLTMEVIFEVAKELPNFQNDKKQLVEEVIIGLYIRMLRCIYHHPQDLPAYLNAWNYWTTLRNY